MYSYPSPYNNYDYENVRRFSETTSSGNDAVAGVMLAVMGVAFLIGLVVFILSDQHIAGARVPAGALAQMPAQVADAYIKAGAADGNDAAVEAALAAGGAIIDLREALTPVTDEAESGEQNPAGA